MKSMYKKLGDYIEPCDLLNDKEEITLLQGISNEKYFQACKSNTNDIDLSRYRICRKGWFAYNRATTRNGDKISIAYRDGEDCLVSPSYKCFRIKDENELNPYYLMLWFKRPQFDRYARFRSHGSAHEYFEYDEMCEVELPIPSIEEQLKIVEAYQTLEHRIELKRQINDNLDATVLTLYKSLLLEQNDDWIIAKLGDVISDANTGGDAIQKVPIVNYDTGIKCARVGDITNKREYDSWSYCKASSSVYQTYKLDVGDILVTRTATLGITQFIGKEIKGVYNNGLIRLKVNKSKALPLYVYWIMQTVDFISYINQINSATSVRPNMKIEYLLDYPITVPPMEIQQSFSRKAEPLRVYKAQNNSEILSLVELQNSLLTRLSSR